MDPSPLRFHCFHPAIRHHRLAPAFEHRAHQRRHRPISEPSQHVPHVQHGTPLCSCEQRRLQSPLQRHTIALRVPIPRNRCHEYAALAQARTAFNSAPIQRHTGHTAMRVPQCLMHTCMHAKLNRDYAGVPPILSAARLHDTTAIGIALPPLPARRHARRHIYRL